MIKGTKKAGHKRSRVGDALFTKVQQSILGLLFANPSRSFYANEIIGLAGSGTGAVQRELGRLETVGLVTAVRLGNQKHYQANAKSPVFEELRSLILKTSGLADVVRDVLDPFSDQIRAAFIYGSIAKGEEGARSDVDLMVISDSLSYGDLFSVLEEASNRLGRKVAPTLYSLEDFSVRMRQRNAFLVKVLSQPKIWLIGTENDLSP